MATILMQGPVLMLGGSNEVNSYKQETITVGDSDE